MKYKRAKRTLDDELRDLVMEVDKLTKVTRELYNNFMARKFGELPTEHLPCDSCKEDD